MPWCWPWSSSKATRIFLQGQHSTVTKAQMYMALVDFCLKASSKFELGVAYHPLLPPCWRLHFLTDLCIFSSIWRNKRTASHTYPFISEALRGRLFWVAASGITESSTDLVMLSKILNCTSLMTHSIADPHRTRLEYYFRLKRCLIISLYS